MMVKKLICLCSALACLCVAATGHAQGPRLRGPDLFGPSLDRGDAVVIRQNDVRIAPEPEPYGGTYGNAHPGSTLPPGAVVLPDGMPIPLPEGGCDLYQRVRYRQTRNIAPCAVPMVVSIKDPCACDRPCDCCAPKCVNVKICVPPCDCADIKVSRNGNKVRYDFGEYAVDICSRRGVVTVDYDD